MTKLCILNIFPNGASIEVLQVYIRIHSNPARYLNSINKPEPKMAGLKLPVHLPIIKNKNTMERRLHMHAKKKHIIGMIISLFLLTVLVSGCSPVRVSDYAGRTPQMVPEEFFNGLLTAHGVVKDRSGKVIRYFNAEIQAYWEGSVGTLKEDFVFDDGEKQQRIWTLMNQDQGQYVGTANDVVGDAKGEVSGNTMFMQYMLEVPYGDSMITLAIDDRMYLVDNYTLINESKMSKLGFEVGEIILVILKQPKQ